MNKSAPQRVVIVGGGFGGLHAARGLRNAPVAVTLIDRRNFHLFQPLLYQVATGGLSPANIATPLRGILRRSKNTEIILGEVTDIDVAGRRVIVGEEAILYDWLVVATGARHHYFGNTAWEPLAPGLKTIEDATEIRRRILLAFEDAERRRAAGQPSADLTFVVVGGGPTGVELAGAIAELAQHTLRHEFRLVDPATARVLLVEGLDRILPTYPDRLSAKATKALTTLGVVVRTQSRVTNVGGDAVTLLSEGTEERIATRTVFWAAGVQASPLGAILARATGGELDRAGRIAVEADCSLPGHAEIFVVGDLACFQHGTERPLPGVAPVAIQQGRYVADVIRRRLDGRSAKPFAYRDWGSMATIGRAAAVVDIGRLHFNGFVAWLAWLFVHLITLVGFENRLLVLLQWAWNYFTRNRSARLITSEHDLAVPTETGDAMAPREDAG